MLLLTHSVNPKPSLSRKSCRDALIPGLYHTSMRTSGGPRHATGLPPQRTQRKRCMQRWYHFLFLLVMIGLVILPTAMTSQAQLPLTLRVGVNPTSGPSGTPVTITVRFATPGTSAAVSFSNGGTDQVAISAIGRVPCQITHFTGRPERLLPSPLPMAATRPERLLQHSPSSP